MTPRSRSLCLLLLLLGLGPSLASAPVARAQFQAWEGSKIIDDPEWQKRFLGSYGFLSGAEPQVGAGELELLREVIDLMKVNPRAAAARLQGETGPDSSAALDFILANLDFQNGQLESAAGHYQRAIEKFPDFRRAHKNLGLLQVQQGDFARGARHLGKAVELGDRDGRNYGLLGYCYLNLDNPLAAESAYRNAVLQEPDTRDWQLGLAQALLAMERHEEAIALFDALLQARPDESNIWLLQANAYLGIDQPRAAAVNLEAVRMLGKAQASTLTLLGDIYMNAGMPELARSAYVEVIEKDARGTGFRTAWRAAELMLRTGAYEDAGQLLSSIDQRYQGLSTDETLELLTLKARLARAEGRGKEAAALLESIVERDGTRGDALLELAAYHHQRGDEAQALLLVERAQKLAAYERQALLAHAQYRVASREYRKAADLLRAALELQHEPRVERFLARVEEAARG